MFNLAIVCAAVLVVVIAAFVVVYIERKDSNERDDLWQTTDSSHYLNEEGKQ